VGKQYEASQTQQVIGGDTQVWPVRVVARSAPVSVWRSADGTCRCTQCSGPLSAMLTSCPHSRAVKRVAARQEAQRG
jgi:hypothetical protein